MGQGGQIEERDVFISVRQDALEVLLKLSALFVKSRTLTSYGQFDLEAAGLSNLAGASNTLISKTKAAIIVMSSNYFSSESDQCFQKDEVEYIIDLYRRRGGKYPLRILLLQNKLSQPRIADFQTQLEAQYPNFGLSQVKVIPAAFYDAVSVSDWSNSLTEVADDILTQLRALQRGNQRFTPVNEYELDYVQRTIPRWAAGCASEARQSDTRGGASEAFRFERHHFFAPQATQIGATDTAAQPVTKWLFNSDYPRLLLCGSAGAGNSVAISFAALGFAWRLHDKTKKQTDEEGIPLEIATAAGDLSYGSVPVVLNAAKVAELRNTLHDPEAALFQAVADVMASATAQLSTEGVRARMKERPYVIFVDELDRLNEADEADLLNHMRSVSGQCEVRVIASGRPAEAAGKANFVSVVLKAPTEEQREAFFRAHAGDDKLALERIRFASRRLPINALDTPMLLSAFCWWARNFNQDTKGAAESQVHLFRTLTEALLAQLPKSEAAKELRLSVDAAREILSAIAFKGLGGSVSLRDAKGIVFAAMDRGEPGAFLSDDEISVLNTLEYQTDLIERQVDGSYRANGLLGDFLAAEHISGAPDFEVMLTNVRHFEAERQWRNALAIACSVMWSSKDEGTRQRGAQLLQALLSRARNAALAKERGDWFLCASAAVAALRTHIDERAALPQQQLINSAADLFAEASVDWTPSTRAESLELISAGVRRRNPTQTRQGVNAVLRRALKLTNDWPKIEGFNYGPGDDGGTRLGGMPVLVAHYEEFLSEMSGKLPPQGVWINEHRNEHRNSDADGEWGVDIWAELRSKPSSPVVFVTYFEAIAYADWLDLTLREQDKLGDDEILRLPTAREWTAMCAAIQKRSKYLWGREPLKEGDAAQANASVARIGRATPPGAFPPYGASELYDFNTNISVWTAPDRAPGESIWPPSLGSGENVTVVGGHFASRRNELGWRPLVSPEERSRGRGIRLVRTRRTTGWAGLDNGQEDEGG